MAKIGTTERTNELLGGQYFDPVTGKQIKEFKPTPLPVSSAPTVANKINTIPEPRVPTVSPYYGNVGEAVASNTGYNKQLEIRLQQIADAEAEKKALAESKNVKEEKSLLKSVLNSVSPQKARETAIQETGIDPKKYFAEQRAKIAEIEKLSEDYNKTEAERDRLIQQIQSNEGQGMLEAGLDSRVRDVERKYAITLSQKSANINTKVATAQALEGHFKEAQTFVNQAVQDATNETKFRYEQYVLLKEANESAFEKLDSKYTKAFDAAMDLAKEEYENQRADKKTIGELLISNPQAGIDIYNDTLEEALNKIQLNPNSPDYLYKQAQILNIYADNARLNSENNVNTSNNFIDIMQSAIDEGATPQQAARAAAAIAENTGIQVDTKTLNDWTSQASKLKQTVISPNTTEQTIQAPAQRPGRNNPRKPASKVDFSFFTNLFGG